MAIDKVSEVPGEPQYPLHAHGVTTKERVPGHAEYYGENGLHMEADGEDHEHEPPVNIQIQTILLGFTNCDR
jgi:hypothetical protein